VQIRSFSSLVKPAQGDWALSALGRRVSRTVNGTACQLVHNRYRIIVERQVGGGQPSADSQHVDNRSLWQRGSAVGQQCQPLSLCGGMGLPQWWRCGAAARGRATTTRR